MEHRRVVAARSTLRKHWLVLAGVPFFSHCGGCFLLGCPTRVDTVSWDHLLPDGGTWAGGQLGLEDCSLICADAGVGSNRCENSTTSTIDCISGGVCKGRLPPGLRSMSGSWLAQNAELEAAAVYAFEHLALELEVHGLPQLARAALEASRDEVRHAAAATRLALKYGVCPSAPTVTLPPEPRSLEELALDNAAEGCGRELLGATFNRWEAEHAGDPLVRAAMGPIAVDEASHARFSFALADALTPRMPLSVRRRAREAQEHALLQLAAAEPPRALRESFGLMEPDHAMKTAHALLDAHRHA
ncbi:MAG: ferritin-like domain-containing protein [Archangiaceae bacterium]|nr:ferritin-like domain-containing protein [Archangiaceae bacterium]